MNYGAIDLMHVIFKVNLTSSFIFFHCILFLLHQKKYLRAIDSNCGWDMDKVTPELCWLGASTVFGYWKMGIYAGNVICVADELCCMG